MPFPRVLVATGSAGHGHVRAAQAVVAALRERHPTLDVGEIDGVARASRAYGTLYRRGYLWMVDRAPGVWRRFYESSDRAPSTFARAATVVGTRRFAREAREWRPDLVLCTHFLAPEVFSREARKGRHAAPIHVVITDHDCHRNWWWPETEAYYVPSDLVRARLHYRYGVPAERIHVTGIPIAAAFSVRRDVVATRARLGSTRTGRRCCSSRAGSPRGRWRSRSSASGPTGPTRRCSRSAAPNERGRRRLAALPRPTGGVLLTLGYSTTSPT